jgi:hypothetical protein
MGRSIDGLEKIKESGYLSPISQELTNQEESKGDNSIDPDHPLEAFANNEWLSKEKRFAVARDQIVQIDIRKKYQIIREEEERHQAKEKIRTLKPSNHLITDKVKVKLNGLLDSVEPKLKEDIKLTTMTNKVQFEKDYQKMDLIMEVMSKDKEFQ